MDWTNAVYMECRQACIDNKAKLAKNYDNKQKEPNKSKGRGEQLEYQNEQSVGNESMPQQRLLSHKTYDIISE